METQPLWPLQSRIPRLRSLLNRPRWHIALIALILVLGMGGAFAVVAYGQSHAASLFSASASQSRIGSSSNAASQSSSNAATQSSPSAATQASLKAAAQYADSHWNCANAACSSTVSAGSGQPNFQCAEFVARS